MNNNSTGCKCDEYEIIRKNLRKTLFNEKIAILKINIEYPQIIIEDSCFSDKFNNFYKSLASNYHKYCEEILSKKICNNLKNAVDFRAHGEIMKYFLTFNNDRFISIIMEITRYDGYFSTKTRFSHVWDIEKGIILPAEFFLRKMKLSVRNLRREICKIVYERIKQGGEEFHYTESRIRRFAHRVNPENFFLVDGGIAFWFPIGTIAPESEGFPAYVIKSEYI